MALDQTLERHLLFPLPRDDATRASEDPVIPRTHPIHDYFKDANWGGTVAAGSVNRVVIDPRTIAPAHGNAGLFTALTSAQVTDAVGDAVEHWDSLLAGDGADEAMRKLAGFVRHVAVALVRRNVAGQEAFELDADAESFAAAFPHREGGGAVERDTAKAMQRGSAAYAALGGVADQGVRDSVFDRLRLHYAFRYLDEVFSSNGGTHDDYFFLARLVQAAKLFFAARLLRAAGQDEKFDQVMAWMHNNSVRYSTVDPDTNALEQRYDADGKALPRGRGEVYALDDMFQRNVELSHQVKSNSDRLQDTKRGVSDARDNLQSLSNSDKLVRSQQRNSIIMYYVAIAMLVLQIGGLLGAEYLKNPLMGFLIIIVYALTVLLIEATRGLDSLVNI